MSERSAHSGGRRSRRRVGNAKTQVRTVDYHNLKNPFGSQTVFSADDVWAVHNNALRILEELGINFLLPTARERFAMAGALVDDDTQIVRIGRDVVGYALKEAPTSFTLRGGCAERDLVLAPGRLSFMSGSGCPHAYDHQRGRRPGTLLDFEELVKLTHSFGALQVLALPWNPRTSPSTSATIVLRAPNSC